MNINFWIASLDPNIQDCNRAFDFLFVSKQNDSDFAKTFDTLRQISIENVVFSVRSRFWNKRHFVDELTQYISDSSQRDLFSTN
jgi:hypothetical protein